MRRWIAVLWHASFLIIAAALYFFFVLPRWYELTGTWGFSLGLSMRIVCGALIGLAALPVVFTWLRSRRPEFGTPQLALTLRFWSIVLHVLAGVLIIGAAISEVWFSLDTAGVYLFGVYGAAAAVALLGAFGFDLAFVAELPPPPPKPLKPKAQKQGRGRGKQADDESEDDESVHDVDDADDVDDEDVVVPVAEDEVTSEVDDVDDVDEVPETTETPEIPETAEAPEASETPETSETSTNGSGNAEESAPDEPGSKVRNRRPGAKPTSRRLGRSRRGIALDD